MEKQEGERDTAHGWVGQHSAITASTSTFYFFLAILPFPSTRVFACAEGTPTHTARSRLRTPSAGWEREQQQHARKMKKMEHTHHRRITTLLLLLLAALPAAVLSQNGPGDNWEAYLPAGWKGRPQFRDPGRQGHPYCGPCRFYDPGRSECRYWEACSPGAVGSGGRNCGACFAFVNDNALGHCERVDVECG